MDVESIRLRGVGVDLYRDHWSETLSLKSERQAAASSEEVHKTAGTTVRGGADQAASALPEKMVELDMMAADVVDEQTYAPKYADAVTIA